MTEGSAARRPAVLAVLGAAVLWGTVGAAQELGAADAPPVAVAAVRTLAGGVLLVLTLVVLGQGARLVRVVRLAAVPTLGAAVAITVFQVGYLTGIRQVGVALGTLVAIGSAPAAAGALAAFGGHRPSRRWMIATTATIAGTAVLLLAGDNVGTGAGSAVVGVLAALVAGAAYGTYTTISKRVLNAGADGPAAMAVIFVVAGVLLAPLLVITDMAWLTSPRGLAAGLWITIAATVVGYTLFARGLRGLDAPSVTTLTLAEPLTATVLAIAVVGERPTVLGAVGAALLLAGLVAVGGRPAAPRPAGTRPAEIRPDAAVRHHH
jgi:drug/metabolite transporter, DME family